MDNTLKIGCVADDFTGASDAASFLLSQGLNTLLLNGIPEGDIPPCNAVVIALKSRTQEVSSAVADSMAAFRWLMDQGAEHLFFKYCSTFDSTPEGNIGPVLDALLEATGAPFSILSPALPVNGRAVKDGILLVDGVPLAETHMRHHPLTPMWDSAIAKLMEPQGKYETLNLTHTLLDQGEAAIQQAIEAFSQGKDHFYVVPDYVTTQHGETVAAQFGHCKVLSGGSGILAPLAARYVAELGAADNGGLASGTQGKGLVLAGSCSKATLGQIADYQEKGGVSYRIDPVKLVNGDLTTQDVWAFIAKNADKEVLIYSSDTPENVTQMQKLGVEKVSECLEGTTAQLAQMAVDAGYSRIIVAGGETSSAVVKKLGFHSFQLGESVAPGVPILAPLSSPDLRVVLKSGNFGQVDFFQRALDMTRA